MRNQKIIKRKRNLIKYRRQVLRLILILQVSIDFTIILLKWIDMESEHSLHSQNEAWARSQMMFVDL